MTNTMHICTLLAAAFLASCSSGIPGFRPLTYSNNSEARVFLSPEQCMHTPQLVEQEEVSPIVAALAIKGVTILFDKFSTALKNGTAAGELPASTSFINFEPTPGTIPNCILIVRGDFADGVTSKGTTQLLDELQDPYTEAEMKTMRSAKYLQEKEKEDSGKGGEAFKQPTSFSNEADRNEWHEIVSARKKQLQRAVILDRYEKFLIPTEASKVKSIDHIFEIQILSSANKRFLSLAPVFAKVDRSIDNDKRGTRSFSLKMEFITKTLSTKNEPIEIKAGAIAILENLRIGETKVYSSINSNKYRFPNETTWFFAFNGSEKKPTAGKDKIDDREGVLQSDEINAAAFSLASTIVEARPNKEGRAFIAEVFEAVKEQAKTLTTGKIQTTAQIKAANKKEYEDGLTAIGEKEDKINIAVEKFNEYCEAVSKEIEPMNRSQLLSKIKAANNASNDLAKISDPADPPIFGAKLEPTSRADNPVNIEVCRRVDKDLR